MKPIDEYGDNKELKARHWLVSEEVRRELKDMIGKQKVYVSITYMEGGKEVTHYKERV